MTTTKQPLASAAVEGRGFQRLKGLLIAAAISAAVALPTQGSAAAAPQSVPRPTASTAPSHLSPTPPSEPKRPRAPATSKRSLTPRVLNAATLWKWQNPLPDGNPLFAISCPTASTCFVVGLSGPIMKTSDGGTTWTSQASASAMNAISCSDASHCVAVGDNGTTIFTNDGGTNWTFVTATGNFLAGVSCPSLTVCFAVGAAGSIIKTIDGGAFWAAQTSGTAHDLFAISCPGTTTCYAVGSAGTITGTTNGTTWNVVAPVTTNALFGISCIGTTTFTCVAVGQGGQVVTAATSPGTIWELGSVGSNVDLAAIICPPLTCFIAGVDGSVYARPTLTVGTYADQASTGASGALFGISCPTATACFAVGDYGIIVATSNGGTGWAQQSSLVTNDLYGISCPSATVCFAVGSGGRVTGTTNGGSTWAAQTSGITQSLLSISCPSTTTCYAVGQSGVVIRTLDGGLIWTIATSNTKLVLLAISCPTTIVCFAVTTGSNFITTVDGATWSPAPLGAALGLTGISCPSTSVCFATDSDNPSTNLIYRSADGGTSWTQTFNLAIDPQAGINAVFNAINCSGTLTCYAVGHSGLIATTSDGGVNWRTDIPSTLADLTGVSCPSASTCFVSASDRTLLKSTDYGGTWAVQFAGYFIQYAFTNVSCASSTACFAVGSGGVVTATTNGGEAWSRQRPAGSVAAIIGLSCVSLSSCYAVAENTLMSTHDGGATWASRVLRTTDVLTAISCPADDTCYAVGWPGAIYKTVDGGTTWTLQSHSLYGSDNVFWGVSCAHVINCVLVGTGGIILSTTDGTTWAPESSGVTSNLYGVSCPGATSCVAVGSAGMTLTKSGSFWQAHISGTHSLWRVSCPGLPTCYAVGTAGTVLVSGTGGLTWTAQASGTAENLFGISCLSTTSCIADGNFGTAIRTLDGRRWTALAPPTFNHLRAAAFVDADHAWVAGFGGTILTTLAPCAVPTLEANPAGYPQVVGTPVTLTAHTTCGAPPAQYQFWVKTPDGVWHMVRNYNIDNTFTWSSLNTQAGNYTLEVDVKNTGSSAAYENYTDIPYSLGLCNIPTLSTGAASSPYPSGKAAITLTGTGSCGGPTEFEFWYRDTNTTWHIIGSGYSSSNTTTWSADFPPGAYLLEVDIRPAGSTAGWVTYYDLPFSLSGCGVPSLMPDKNSPQVAGTMVTWTAFATCSGTPQYEFYVRTPDGRWSIPQPWGASNTFAWASPSGPGSYMVEVDVRNAGAVNDPYDYYTDLAYTLGVCNTPTLSTGAATSPYPSGKGAITLTATGTCSGGPEYEFYYRDLSNTWHIIGAGYSSSATSTWKADYRPGGYVLEVDIRPAGSTAAYVSYVDLPFSLSGCGVPGLTPDKTSPQTHGTKVTWTATVTCTGTTQYQFWVRAAGVWSMIQDYSASSTFAWPPVTAGSYMVEVDVRNSGANDSAYDNYTDIAFVVT